MKTRRKGTGAALVMVVWILAALAVLLSEFIFSARTSLNALRNQKADAAGYYLALAAYNLATEEIARSYKYLLPGDDGGVVFVREGDKEPVDLASTERRGELAGVGKYSYRIEDEESKINLNWVERRQLTAFLKALGWPDGVDRDTVVDSLADWRDVDDLHRLNGAEDEYYQTLTPPYHSKNADLDTAEEWLLVKGMTPERFYGTLEGAGRPLAGMVTVHGERLNFNTAPAAALTAYLGEVEATKIATQRAQAPFRDARGQSNFYTIVAEGRPAGASFGRTIRVIVERRTPTNRPVRARIVRWDDTWAAPPAPVAEERAP
jgi:general secretion pathway protein K